MGCPPCACSGKGRASWEESIHRKSARTVGEVTFRRSLFSRRNIRKDETQKRLEQPTRLARSWDRGFVLRRSSSRLPPNFTHPFFAEVARAVVRSCAPAGRPRHSFLFRRRSGSRAQVSLLNFFKPVGARLTSSIRLIDDRACAQKARIRPHAALGRPAGKGAPFQALDTGCPLARSGNTRCRRHSRPPQRCSSSPPRLLRTTPGSP